MRLGSRYRALIAPRLGIVATGPAVLDVGAGDGDLLRRMGAGVKVALDPARFRQSGIRAVQGDGTQAPFAPGSFDTVLALDVLEHVADDAALVRALMRMVKPGGVVWVSVPAREHAVFPGFITPWLHRRWGHLRPGYRLPDVLALFPDDAKVTTLAWNEPWFRALYVPLRALAALTPPLARAVLPLIARLDGHATAGDHGHYFLRVAMSKGGNDGVTGKGNHRCIQAVAGRTDLSPLIPLSCEERGKTKNKGEGAPLTHPASGVTPLDTPTYWSSAGCPPKTEKLNSLSHWITPTILDIICSCQPVRRLWRTLR